MDNNRVTAAPSVSDPPARTDARRAFRRRTLRRFVLRLPELSLLVVLAALVVVGGVQLAARGDGVAQQATGVANHVYTVDQVRDGLQQDPSAWLGRAILVRGVLQGDLTFCGQINPCPPETLGLMDDGNAVLAPDQYVPVVRDGAMNAGDLRYNVPATYRLQLRAAPDACALNPDILCYQGTILGAVGSQ
jgi:hypothetical protein